VTFTLKSTTPETSYQQQLSWDCFMTEKMVCVQFPKQAAKESALLGLLSDQSGSTFAIKACLA